MRHICVATIHSNVQNIEIMFFIFKQIYSQVIIINLYR